MNIECGDHFVKVMAESEAEALAEVEHHPVIRQNSPRDLLNSFLASDFDEQLQQLASQTSTLPGIPDGHGEFGAAGAPFTAEACDAGNGAAAVRPVVHCHERQFPVVIVQTDADQSLVVNPAAERHQDATQRLARKFVRRGFDGCADAAVMDGLTAAAEIRRSEQPLGRHQYIVEMTAHAMSGDRERCLDAGMDDYISKPVTPRALLDILSRVPVPSGITVIVASRRISRVE